MIDRRQDGGRIFIGGVAETLFSLWRAHDESVGRSWPASRGLFLFIGASLLFWCGVIGVAGLVIYELIA